MALILNNISFGSSIMNLSYRFKESHITALYGLSSSLVDILLGKVKFSGEIKQEFDSLNKIVYVENNALLYASTVEEEFKIVSKACKIEKHILLDRIEKYLNLFGFDREFLNRLCITLSKTEILIVNIIKKLIVDYNVIIFDRIFKHFDYKYTKILKQLINNLKAVGKVVIIIDDINIFYNLASEMLIINNDGSFYAGDVRTICTDVELLQSFSLEPPILSQVTYQARKRKKVNISYHKDVRDLIKDVYKHV